MLFGHERGAFTGAERAHRGLFEEAGAGTVLLDEVGDTPLRLQVALLRVLETGEIRPVGSAASRKIACRIVAATNADLNVLTEKGLFRKDLLYRLRRLEIPIPPLRERRDDILPLVDHFLREGRTDNAKPEPSAELKAALLRHVWPGNVRELRNVIEKMRLLHSDKPSYDAADLEAEDVRVPAATPAESARERSPYEPEALPVTTAGGEPLGEGRSQMRRMERLRALFRQHGRLTRAEAIRILAVSQATATRDLKALCAEGVIEKVRPTAAPRTHFFALRRRP